MVALNYVSTGDPHVAAHNEERNVININDSVLAGKLNKPAGARAGDLLRYDGTNWVSSATRLFEGSGSPQGVIAAPIGSRYVDISGTAGAVEWLKASGASTDNTGWILLAGDTGWRNVSSIIDRRGTAVIYSAFLRRVGDVVDMYLDLETPTNNTTPWTVLTLPRGFRPSFVRLGSLQGNTLAATQGTGVGDDGVINFFFPKSNVHDRYNGFWTTTNSWPSSLPGSPI